MTDRRLHVVSVSLGSSQRDKQVEFAYAGRQVLLERIGVDGDLDRAVERIAAHDGVADAIGLGGIDLWLQAGRRRYAIRDAQRLAAAASRTPVVDGSGLKNTLEAALIRRLDDSGIVQCGGRQALLVSGVDRWGMAEALAERCAGVVFGDLIFALGLPIALRRLALLERLARLVLPVMVRLPFRAYPTGAKQEGQTPRHGRYFAAADIIAGDFHFIRRFMPPALDGKTIVTNTTTEDDVRLLRERGAALLVTTTPRIDGRSFGTNVMEAMLTALAGSREPLPAERLMNMLDEVGWEPSIERLQETTAAGLLAP